MRNFTKNLAKKSLAMVLTAVLSISLIACGNHDTSADNPSGEKNGTNEGTGYVYVPEYTSLETEEDTYLNRVTLQGEKLYYSTSRYEEETGESEELFQYRELSNLSEEKTLPVTFECPEGYVSSMSNFFFDSAQNLYIVWYVYQVYVEGEEYDYDGNTTYLTKYDSEMNQVWALDLGTVMTDENNSYIQEAVISKEGKIYAASNNLVYVITNEGTFDKTIPVSTDWINGMVSTEEGRVFLMQYGMNGMEIVEIVTSNDSLGEIFANLPDSNGLIKGGTEGKLLISGSSKLYEYDMATQESTALLDWVDCDIDGNYVQGFSMLEDGRIAVYYDNYSDDPELTLLTRTEASKVAQKQIITLATLYGGDSALQQAVVRFNKLNGEYRIKIKSYIDHSAEWTETTYSDAIARMNADIVGDSCPDIIDLSNVDLNNLASKGAFADLTPYLEASTIANKADFVPSVLDAYNIDGVQVTVPGYFNIATLLAKSSLVGEEPGWTLDDVIALADANPDASLMHYVNKESALEICLMFSSDTFIDYETGTCNFESPEFIKVLEFANRFAEEENYEESLPSMIQSGKVLLSNVSFGDVQEYQMYNLMFEDETTSIGYPTFDGSAGVFISGYETYGISAKSEFQDGAWEFIESILAESREEYHWQFPSRTEELEQVFEEAMEKEYRYDENGGIMHDEAGNPIEEPKTNWGYDDWDADIYAATEKEIEDIKVMIENAKPISQGDETIYTMISEEAAAYFTGQKSAEDVAKIIQSRVEIYVSVNN